VCVEPVPQFNGDEWVITFNGYADATPNAFGSNPVNVLTSIEIGIDYETIETGPGNFTQVFIPANGSKDFSTLATGPDDFLISATIQYITPTSYLSQNYINSGLTDAGACA
jgi:hypothetical protein